MKIRSSFLLLAASASFLLNGCTSPSSTPVASNGVTADAITVAFKDSDKFTDARESMGGPTSQHNLDLISAHLKKKAPAFLQAGQKLSVTFTDIDLAGDFQPSRRPGMDDVRIIKPIYRPRMELDFEVRDAASQVVKQGHRSLMDLNFQADSTTVAVRGNEPLAYDLLLLTHWLEREFK